MTQVTMASSSLSIKASQVSVQAVGSNTRGVNNNEFSNILGHSSKQQLTRGDRYKNLQANKLGQATDYKAEIAAKRRQESQSINNNGSDTDDISNSSCRLGRKQTVDTSVESKPQENATGFDVSDSQVEDIDYSMVIAYINQQTDPKTCLTIPDNLMEDIELISNIVEEVASLLDTTPTDVIALMEAEGMAPSDVMDVASWSKIFLEHEAEGDISQLLIDEELLSAKEEFVAKINSFIRDNVLANDGNEPVINIDSIAKSLQKDTTVENNLDENNMSRTLQAQLGSVEPNAELGTYNSNEQGDNSKNSGEREDSKFDSRSYIATPQYTMNANGDIMVTTRTVVGNEFGAGTQAAEILDQVTEYIRINSSSDMTELEMQLNPASLGKVLINITSKGGVLTASLMAESQAVKVALEGQVISLKDELSSQGIKVEAVEVSVATHQFESALNQGRQSGNTGGDGNSKRRRINLNDIDAYDGNIVLPEDEELITKLMREDGSTVDYTA